MVQVHVPRTGRHSRMNESPLTIPKLLEVFRLRHCKQSARYHRSLSPPPPPPPPTYFQTPSYAAVTMNSSDSNVDDKRVITVTNSVSVVVCLLAAILVIILKLYKKIVYRLALYQVLASLALATIVLLQGVLLLYADWMKLLFTMWVTFHLFCFAVLHKNLKKLEVLYVVTSLLVPAVIACIPLITHSYGRSQDGTACYIYAFHDAASIEMFTLWDGPAMIFLLATSTAMVVMVIKLTGRVCLRARYEPITDGDRFWKALKQLLPLAAFPILFFFFEIPVFIFHVYATTSSTPNMALEISKSVFISLWSMTSGGTLLIHIFVVKWKTIKSFLHFILLVMQD